MQIALATEDALSEAIGLRLLAELPSPAIPNLVLGKKGSGYLRTKMPSWRQIAQRQALLILTDLDRINCAPIMRADWIGRTPLPENLVLRIAVREIESWALADHEALRMLIGNKGTLPPSPDALPDPKQHLLNLARLASRPVRLDLLGEVGAIASQGLGYNARLTEWVRSSWDPARASHRSPSLERTRIRLGELAARIK